jgi:flagellin
MSITVNTNIPALIIQTNLSHATNKMNTTMERMSSGYRINSAADDAAGLSVTTRMNSILSSSKIASDNVAIAKDFFSTYEQGINELLNQALRMQNLAVEHFNGTYTPLDLDCIKAEVLKVEDAVQNIFDHTEFNGINLFVLGFDSVYSNGITFQIGPNSSDNLAVAPGGFGDGLAESTKKLLFRMHACRYAIINDLADQAFERINEAIEFGTTALAQVGAYQNRLTSISESLDVQQTNLTSSVSTIKDADIAEESALYVAQKILQSASATLLVQANTAPQIALTLIQG